MSLKKKKFLGPQKVGSTSIPRKEPLQSCYKEVVEVPIPGLKLIHTG